MGEICCSNGLRGVAGRRALGAHDAMQSAGRDENSAAANQDESNLGD